MNPVNRRRLRLPATITSGLSGFGPLSLIQGAAALALWPPNADRHVALNALVNKLGTKGTGGARSRRITAREWRRWLSSRSSARLRSIQADGIHDSPLCVQTALLGYRRSLLAGYLEFPDLHYRLWMEALATLLAEGPDPALRAALDLLENVSRLSDRVVSHAGLGFYPLFDHSADHKIGVPDDPEYARLSEALMISGQELESSHGLDGEVLATLVRTDPPALSWQPLVSTTTEGFVVADPWRLTLAGLVRACGHTAASPKLPALLERLTSASLDVAEEAATNMDWSVERLDDRALLAQADLDCQILISVCLLAPNAEAEPTRHLLAPDSLADAYHYLAQRAAELKVQHSLLAFLADGRGVTVTADHPCFSATDAKSPWLLGLPELQLLGDALRRDPLALPSALEHTPRPPWPPNFDLVDFVGIARYEEEPPLNRGESLMDGTEYLYLRSRIMAARHPAPRSDGKGWGEIARWGGSPDSPIFCARNSESFSLAVRVPGYTCWVVCADPSARPDDLQGVICQMLTYWIARLCERGWPRLQLKPVSAEIAMHLQVELSEGAGPALSIGMAGDRLRLIASPGFVHAMCRGDNSADRMLIAAVLCAVGEYSLDAQIGLLEEVAPAGRATVALWPDPEVRRTPPQPLPPPPIASRDRLAVQRELAATLCGPHDIFVFQKDEAQPALGKLVSLLDQRIADRIAGLSPNSLAELVCLYERSQGQSNFEAMSLPARAVLTDADEHLGPREGMGSRDLALRVLIERASAATLSGERQLGRREGNWLRAATELELELGSAYDALAAGQTTGRVIVGLHVGISVDLDGALPAAGGRMSEQIAQAAPDLMVHEYSDWWGDQDGTREPPQLDVPIDLEPRLVHVDEALKDEWGIGLDELLRLLRALSDLADREANAVAIRFPKDVARSLCRMTQIEQPTVVNALELLTLGPCDAYDVTRSEHRPWGANRERSYLRRPLVQLPNGRLAWSYLHILTCARYLFRLIDSNRLRGGPKLRRAIGKYSQQVDREFEWAVLSAVRDAGWRADPRVKEIAGFPLERCPGQEIGDIDVLAWSPEQQRVLLLDAKRLAPSLEPYAMIDESRKLAKKAPPHRERLEWVRQHSEHLAKHVGDDAAAGWDMAAALVIDRPLAGAHFRELELPVWTFRELPSKLR